MASGVWAQRVGDLQATNFAPTVAGVNAALAYTGVGGGTVLIDAGAGIPITTTSIKIPNRARLLGLGDHTATATFVCSAATNVSAVIENTTQDGTQQYAYVEHISINGNRGSGAIVTTGILFKSVYVGSRIKDVLVYNTSGRAITIDGGTTQSAGQMILDNITLSGGGDDGFLITGPVEGIFGYQITSEQVDAGKALMKITLGASAGPASFGHYFYGVHFEANTACKCLVLDQCSNVMVDGITYDGNGLALSLVEITGTATGADGAFGCSGHVIRNAFANLTTIINDVSAGVTVGNAQSRFVREYHCPTVAGGANNSQLVGIQANQQGADIVAAATITPGNGNLFQVTGNTNITAITANARDKGRIISLTFTGTPTISDGGNLKLNGAFTPGADDTVTMICDGTNWRELGRANSGGNLTVGGTLFQLAGSVASATDMTLPSGNIFLVTGTTTINKLLPVSSGRVVHLKFSGNIRIQDLNIAAGNISLRGGVSFNAIDQDVISFYSDSTNWIEISRRTIGSATNTTIASAATIAIPSYGVVFHVTGNTNITNGITVNPIDFGRQITLIFDSTPTVSDTGTSVLNGNLVATASDTLTLVCDGTNWLEVARSSN